MQIKYKGPAPDGSRASHIGDPKEIMGVIGIPLCKYGCLLAVDLIPSLARLLATRLKHIKQVSCENDEMIMDTDGVFLVK